MKRDVIVLLISLMLIGLLGTASMSQEAGTWTRKADMRTGRFFSGAAVVDGKIYVIGGGPKGSWLSTVVEEYDTAADIWAPRVDIPTTGIHCLGAAAVDGVLYAIGGWVVDAPGDVPTVLAYDPAVEKWTKADKWTRKTDMPTRRCRLTTSVVDGKIYAIGGKRGSDGVSTVEVYDPATDKWTRKADMPTARMEHAACVIDGRIYVSGGYEDWDTYTPTLSSVEVYDPATDTWVQSSDMPWARNGHTASAVDGKMYIIGGHNTETFKLFDEGKIDEDEVVKLLSTVDVYDPATDTWTTAADFPFLRSYLSAAVVDGKIYAIGGGRDVPDDVYSRVDEFDPSLSNNTTVISPAGKLPGTWGQIKKVQ
jgi:N-acetylneuraminic acid mutarotase